MHSQLIVKEYEVAKISKEDLADILMEIFGNGYSCKLFSSGYRLICKTDFPYYGISFPSKNTYSGLWGEYSSDGSSWSDISMSAYCSHVKIYKEEGKFIYVTGITSDNKEHYAGGFMENSSCFVWMDYIYNEVGESNKIAYSPITADNYISLAPFFNTHEKISNPDYTDIFIPAIRPSLDGTYTVFNINGERYATMSKNIFVKI